MREQFLTETVLNNPYIPHTPTPKQGVFLSLPHHEAFYGGAAGGGKSDALLMAALQFVDVPGYASLLLRRSFQDLALPGALLDRAHSWLAPSGARWRDQAKQWEFSLPYGEPATLNFGYLQSERDKYRYQSSEFDYIGFDELTQFTSTQYVYLFSRLRKGADSKVPFVRMRSASNPGNEGHQFVKIRFVEPGDPSRPFIAANLKDNPYIDQESYMFSLAQLDPITRAQLERGVWDEPTPEGSYYGKWLELARGQGRIGIVPYEPQLPVDTWWDLGIATGRDSMTLWFTQTYGREIRIIDCYGNSGEGFPFYVKVLRDKPYVYGKHHAPHDIMVKELGTGKTRLEQARALGLTFEIVPDIGFDEGVNAVRTILNRCWFSKEIDRGLRALFNYRKEWDDRGQRWQDHPFKDWCCDYADAFRMMAVGFRDKLEYVVPHDAASHDYDPYAARE